jgi:hypothetical protein
MSIADPIILAYLPFKNPQALLDWALGHGDLHRLVAQKAVQQGHTSLGTYEVYDMVDMEEWLYQHNQEHEQISETYNLQTPPDLSYWDFNDEVNFANWLFSHSLVHDNEVKVIGI